jgi:hypothetical protein
MPARSDRSTRSTRPRPPRPRDGWAVQALTLGGDVATGITASIVVGV